MHLICSKCKVEMRCFKTGMSIRYRKDGSHVYPADLYTCDCCKATVVVSPGIPYYQEEPDKKSGLEDIWMDKDE